MKRPTNPTLLAIFAFILAGTADTMAYTGHWTFDTRAVIAFQAAWLMAVTMWAFAAGENRRLRHRHVTIRLPTIDRLEPGQTASIDLATGQITKTPPDR